MLTDRTLTVARHNSERYSSVKVIIFLAYMLEILGIDFGAARIATTLLLDLPNSRKLEYEGVSIHDSICTVVNAIFGVADQLGLGICARACYDPRASPE